MLTAILLATLAAISGTDKTWRGIEITSTCSYIYDEGLQLVGTHISTATVDVVLNCYSEGYIPTSMPGPVYMLQTSVNGPPIWERTWTRRQVIYEFITDGCEGTPCSGTHVEPGGYNSFSASSHNEAQFKATLFGKADSHARNAITKADHICPGY